MINERIKANYFKLVQEDVAEEKMKINTIYEFDSILYDLIQYLYFHDQ